MKERGDGKTFNRAVVEDPFMLWRSRRKETVNREGVMEQQQLLDAKRTGRYNGINSTRA